MRQLLAAMFAFAVVAAAAPAEAKHHKYRSRHPFKGGFCHINVVHVHAYAPADTRLYRVTDGDYYFVGDPVAYGYDGPKYAYYGAHPVVEADIHFGSPVYCYLDGSHYHWYQPPPSAQFEVRAGVNWFVGTYEPVYWDERPRYVVINEAYRPMRYDRPVVAVSDAPPQWRAPPPGRARGHVRAEVAVPAPSVHFG